MTSTNLVASLGINSSSINLSQNHQVENPVPMSRSKAAFISLSTLNTISQVTLGILGITQTVSQVPLGWSIVGLSAAMVIVPTITFFCADESERTPMNFGGTVTIPLFLQTAPFVCGVLSATGHLSSRTLGWVVVGVIGGALACVCKCSICFAAIMGCKECLPLNTDNPDIEKAETEELLGKIKLHKAK